ncbi:MAG: polyprenyl synthetase family protein [Planctomycetota bacterium]
MVTLVDIARAAGTEGSVADAVRAGLDRVVERFEGQLNSRIAPVADLCAHVSTYRGKMLRPALVMVAGLAASARRGRPMQPITDELVTIGAVLEMVHVATLVHDDVLDHSDTRRGGATVNRLVGNESAVMLGDYLIARSFHLCSQLDDQSIALRVGQVTSQVCEGEVLQLSRRGDLDLSLDTYWTIIELKTAALIAGAAQLGAQAVNADPMVAGKMHDFGIALGKAFQVQDDLLDLTGDQAAVGKPVANDVGHGELTLPLIHHLSMLSPVDRERAEAVIQSGDRSKIVAMLNTTDSIGHAKREAERLVDEAIACLDVLEDSPAKAYLRALAGAVVNRDH